MPVIRVEMFAGRTREQKQQLAEALTRDTAAIAGCSPDDVHVIFADVERHDWAIGGRIPE